MAGMIIAIDTREQRPFSFRSITDDKDAWSIQRATMPTGDYGLLDQLHWPKIGQIVIERKSLPDLYNSVAGGRKRFEREFGRLAEYGYAALVIEADWPAICEPGAEVRSSVAPRSVIRTLIAWSQRYGVHVFPCPGRRFAEQLTFRMLDRWAKDCAVKPNPVDRE